MKRKNNWIILFVASVVIPLAIAVLDGHAQSINIKIGSYDPAFELDMKSTNGQFGSTNIKCQVFKRIVEEKTNERIKVTILPNGQLGGDREAFEMVKAGSLQMSAYPGGVLSGFVSEIMAVSIPYMFKDLNVAWRVVEGSAGKELENIVLKKTGVRILAWGFDGPYSNIMTVNKEIRVPNDLKGVKIRLPQDSLRMEAMKAAGGSPTPLSWGEVYTALQQGVVDGMATTLAAGAQIKAEKMVKYVNMANPFLAVSNLYINEKFYQSLSPSDKRIVREAAYKAMRVYDGLGLWGEGLWIDFYKQHGVKVYFPTQAEMELWKNALKNPTVKFVKGQINPDFVDRFLKASEQAEKELYGE